MLTKATSDIRDDDSVFSGLESGQASSTRGATEGAPPAGWVWVWLGSFKRWRKRFVSAETPGLLVIRHSKGARRKVWTLNLEGSSVMFDTRHARQFAARSQDGTVYLRTLHAKQRNEWVHQIKVRPYTLVIVTNRVLRTT